MKRKEFRLNYKIITEEAEFFRNYILDQTTDD